MLPWGWGGWEACVGPGLGLQELGLGSLGSSEQGWGNTQSLAALEH